MKYLKYKKGVQREILWLIKHRWDNIQSWKCIFQEWLFYQEYE